MLVLSAGTGLLGLLAASSGAKEVICIERSRFLYRMAKQALQANTHLQNQVTLVGRRLRACGVQGMQAAFIFCHVQACHEPPDCIGNPVLLRQSAVANLPVEAKSSCFVLQKQCGCTDLN